MLQAFIIVLREGFEAFLIVAIILAYLHRTGRKWLTPAVYWGILASAAASVALAYVLKTGVDERRLIGWFGENAGTDFVVRFFNVESLREGILGAITIPLVATLVVHMWRTGGQLKNSMETRLRDMSSRASRVTAFCGVFLFTAFMITREGMETVLLLLQVHDRSWVSGSLAGLGAAGMTAWLWVRFRDLLNLKRFFQVTAIYLFLFMGQVAVYTFHEFAEAGLLPNSTLLHDATEPFSPAGHYGKWFSVLMILGCLVWLAGAWVADRHNRHTADTEIRLS